MQNILFIGGLGFIGYHAIKALTENNYKVTVLARSAPETATNGFNILVKNISQASDSELVELLKPFDFVVFGGGADDRTIPTGDAAQFFYNENVVPCVRLARASQKTKVQKIVILGSYFVHFNRVCPEWKMAERHVYVRSRVLQETETIAAARENGGKTAVVALELPYIFGVAPQKTPLWKPLIQYIKQSPIVFYTEGGTNMMSVAQVAAAILGAIKYAQHGDCLPTGGENLRWDAMLKMMMDSLGKRKPIVALPKWLVLPFAWLTGVFFKITGKQSGLNPYHFIEVQSSKTWFDASETMQYLHINSSFDLPKAIDETVKASV